MNPLGRSQILSVAPAPPVPVEVPEWGGTVFLRVMDGRQRERFEQVYTAGNRADIRATMLAFTVTDESGSLLFTAEDIPALNALAAPALMRLYDRSLALNAVTREQIEELAGN